MYIYINYCVRESCQNLVIKKIFSFFIYYKELTLRK